MEIVRLGGLWDDEKKHQAGSVWDKHHVSPTIDSMQGGGREPMIIDVINAMPDGTCRTIKSQYANTSSANFAYSSTYGATGVIEKSIVAMRGRNPENPSDRTVGSPTEQRLEPNSQGLCNTLTSVQN